MREKVSVALGERAYEVVIGPDLIAGAGALVAPLLARPRVVVLTDETVAGLHLEPLRRALEGGGIDVAALALPPGEATKGWAQLQRAVGWLLDQKVERNDIVIALGGGVIGDLAGFAAAVLRRGVRFVQIPTSLLAQVDSSVGGKTGINAAQGKNLIGVFHQPGLVLADIQLADGSSGIETVEELLSFGDVPVIFISAYPERLLTGERPEPTYLVTKPFREETVRAAIGQALFFGTSKPLG